eukprot:scaffold128758_cov34-Prasinocladus_malaysianus.AAC.1
MDGWVNHFMNGCMDGSMSPHGSFELIENSARRGELSIEYFPLVSQVGGLASSTSMQEQWCLFCSGGLAEEVTPDSLNTNGAHYGGMVGLALRGAGLTIESI